MVVNTKWTCHVDSRGLASVLVEFSNDPGRRHIFRPIKGICYSPCPLNNSNADAPNIGDWFWDSFRGTGYQIQGWDALWKRDLPEIRFLGANAIRVYCMLSRQLNGEKKDANIPIPWNKGNLFTHNNFLDLCWAGGPTPDWQSKPQPLYVLVGIPLPAEMFWKQQYRGDSSPVTTYWTQMLRETAQDVGKHPAVMGFTIQNEIDGADVCYNNPEWAKFWWGQVEKMAKIVKEAAPDKLVGMATHDDNLIPGKAASYMANCPHIDFWGVNTYQLLNFDSVFRITPEGPGYSGLKGAALKPVILTEYGLPATGHRNDSDDPDTIYEDETTRSKTAKVIGPMLPKAIAEDLCLGLFYFEFCDEWWNQPGQPNKYTWWGGVRNEGFPNHFWDNHGFGIYSIRRGDGLKPDDPTWKDFGQGKQGPNEPVDVHRGRSELRAEIAIYKKWQLSSQTQLAGT
jgi:hypothetical protein